ncbi:uridine kinase family protein [Streptomyces sp. NBC_01244]|uniref:uridine kinase family protein n=1 Tax=Streptomyces sp. NBC_01244 TaxID=2903797 RepID=UPI002E0FA7AE|nr:AAA family ATPase [Streptomyces sp. NBC_01244]
MPDSRYGLPPERAALMARLVDRCTPLLERGEGMEQVQQLLRELGTGVMDSIIVTRNLLGAGLAEAKEIVLSSAAWTTGPPQDRQPVDLAERAGDVAEGLLRLPPTRRATRLLAVDGAGGSGKTTLATAVATLLGGAVVVHVDDFYRPMPEHEREQLDAEQGYHRYFDWERLRDQVLIPLRAGRAVRYQLYDWSTGRLGAWREVARGSVVIVEGVYSARPELAPYYDLTAYVDTPRDVCLRRVRARGENSEEWILRWRAAEDHYLRTTWPQTRAGLLVRGY